MYSDRTPRCPVFRPAPIAVLATAVMSAIANAAPPVETHTTVRRNAGGERIVESYVPMIAHYSGMQRGSAPAAPANASAAGSGVVWSDSVAAAIYTTTAIAAGEERLLCGTYLNPPKEVQRFPLDGPAVPEWTFAGERLEVAAARDADVLAAVDYAALTVTVRRWHAASATPDWTRAIGDATLATFRTVVVSPDGSTIAVLVNDQGGESARAALYYFDSASSTPLGSFTAPDGHFARNLAISTDGAYIAFMGGSTVYVIDRDAAAVRYSVSAGATNDPIAISGDGTCIAYGWSSLFVREWNGATYALSWSRSGAGRFLRSCVLSTDGSTFAAGWASSATDRNRVEIFEPASLVPLWSYDYAQASGPLQDVVSDMAITANGSHVAVASWGDESNANDEIHVFERGGSAPVLTVDTPGSMFDVDIARAPGGAIRVSAGGKHIHAGISGHGGDLYSIRLLVDCTADVDGDGLVGFDDLLIVLSTWGPCPGCAGDIDGDGVVGFDDLLLVLSNWGPCA